MENSEYLRLLMPNGTHTLLDKSEYLNLARLQGWDIKIPQLEDGVYNCDVFGGDGVKFAFGFAISGTLFLKDYAILEENVAAHGGFILGDNASTNDLYSKYGDIILGDNADTCELTGEDVICGDCLYTNDCNISATDGFVILGKDFGFDDILTSEISAAEDIICDDEPAAEAGQNS